MAPRARFEDVRTQVIIMNMHLRAASFFTFALIGCSSETQSSFGSDNGDASTGGQNASSGGSGNGGSGASGGARAGSGGASGTGASIGTGGSPVQCRTNADCPALGCYMCSSYCENGRCITYVGGGTGGAGSGGTAGAGGMGSGGHEVCLVCGGTPGSGGAPPAARCPSTMPTDGASCTGTIGPCTYGDHPITYCRATAGCGNGKWTVTPVPAACTQLEAGCPSSAPNGACDAPNTLSCNYQTASCGCAPCCDVPGCAVFCGGQPQGTKVWGCSSPPVGNQYCPGVIPNQGVACELPSGTACLTNPCGLNVTCENGAWKWEYKTDFTCNRVCASPDTPIATPEGERPIAELRPGDVVYSVDHDAIVAVPIARVRQVHVENHSVLKIALEGGRSLEISPLHPDAEGVLLGNLHAGDLLERTRIERVSLIPYTHDSTYDILPASDTGTYFAAGVLMGSTLKGAPMPRSLQ